MSQTFKEVQGAQILGFRAVTKLECPVRAVTKRFALINTKHLIFCRQQRFGVDLYYQSNGVKLGLSKREPENWIRVKLKN